MDKILLVEDADTLREVLVSVLQDEGFEVLSFPDAESALKADPQSLSCIVCDFKLPGINGIEFLSKIRSEGCKVPFLLMTAYGSTEIAVTAMKNGANDYISKPFEPERLCSAIRETIQHKRIFDHECGAKTRRNRKFLTAHPTVSEILSQAEKVARVDSSVLILGESGTGKELLARFIHEKSPRKDNQFIAINCAAMPADLLESEFFGHEQGAFTGATQTRIGVFELASQGTIFLDEIAEMPSQLQVKLLRALQEREIKRVGGTKTIKVNPRVLAATNHDAATALDSRLLREDLFFRIAVITFTIPPLRERPCDINLLASYFLDYFSSRAGKNLAFSDAALKLLNNHSWPGNGRELENVIERAVILAGERIEPEHLGIELSLDFSAIEESTRTLTEVAEIAARNAETALIRKTLNRTMGNKSKAAQLLGVSYKTLLNKVKEYRLDQVTLD